MRCFVVTFALLGLLPVSAAADNLNEKVAGFARSHLGKEVGDGECWTLADQALRAAGAHRPNQPPYGTYVFGKKVSSKAIMPGDVVEFQKAYFDWKDAKGGRYILDFGIRHTAIVGAVHGSSITLLHQNYNGKRTVQQTPLDLAGLRRGTATFYRPQPR
jgi:hypothetical protein